MIPIVLVLFFLSLAEARVSLTYSEFIDAQDLQLSPETDFKCPRDCLVYSATENKNLVIVNKATQQEITSLNDLAFYNNAKDRSYLFGVKLTASTYTLKNRMGDSGALFGLYVVYNDAPNYGQALRVAEAFSTSTFSTTNSTMTIMTRGTGIRMVTLNSASEMAPRIFATGYDAITSADKCDPLYTANSLAHAQNSQIDVIGPIATIRFDGLPASAEAHVKVSGDVLTDAPEKRNSLTISSPGFTGCNALDGSSPGPLYQYNLNKLDRRFLSDLDLNTNIHIHTKQWLPEPNQVVITGLQDQPIKLSGVTEYIHDFPVSKVDVRLTWQRAIDKDNSTFAVQMDATKSAEACSLLISLAFALLFVLQY